MVIISYCVLQKYTVRAHSWNCQSKHQTEMVQVHKLYYLHNESDMVPVYII